MNGQQERTGNPNSSYLYGPSLYRSSFSTFTTGGANTTTSLTTSTPSPTSGPPSIEKKIRFASDSSRSKIDDTTNAKKQSYLSSSRDTSPVVSTTTATPTSGGLSALPRYTGSSFNTGYRLASLDRLAQRHKVYEKEELASVETNGIGGTTEPVATSSTTTTPTHISYSTNLQNKRDQFFRNDSSTTNGGTPTANGGPPVSSTITMPTSAMQSAKEALLANKENRPELKHDVSKDKDKEKDRDREKDKKVSERRTRQLDGYVGFANLPNQVYRKAVKKGFEFTLMVVGESGLGKSTLINSMFLTDIYSTENPGPSQRIKKTVQVETTQSVLKEKGVNLTLTIVDTPGFGDAVDNSNCWQPVTEHLEAKFEEYLNAESRVHRRSIADGRVHCCLYFIAPSGHGLKPLDVEFMKRLHDKVNIIPVLAKADTMTPDECARFKKQIMNEIAQHKIKIYEFPDCDDEEENKLQRPLKDRVPFAVVGANTIIEIEGRKVRGRKYPWGIAEVENMEHCDFLPLRNMVIRTHMQDLKEVTNNVHYENYRCRKLAGIGLDGKPSKISNKNPLAQMEEEKKEHEAKMKKTEAEMEQVFEMKVREKKNKLKESEAELQRRHEQMRRPLEQQQKELEEKRAAFEQERQAWEQANNVTIEELRRRSLESSSKELVDGKEKNKKKKGLF